MKRLLTFDDLYNFYASSSISTHFSSEQDDKNIVVQSFGKIRFGEEDKNKEGLIPVHLQSCHTGKNENKSNIDTEVMNSAMPSFCNRPILAYIHEVDGEYYFYKHNMHKDKDGNIVYDEIPVGIIPESCNAKLVYDEDKGQEYVEVDGYIYKEYSKASDILEREQECSVSVELSIRELSYNAQEKCLNIEDFYFSGVTILGKDEDGEDVKPGMTGSNIKLTDFSKENNSIINTNDKKIIEMLEKLNDKIDNISSFTINEKSQEGGTQVHMFEKLLKKYNKAVEDINFDYSKMSDDELVEKFSELFGETETETTEDVTENENDTTESENTEDTNDEGEKFSLTKGELFNKLFEISFNDIHSALNSLCEIYRNSEEWCYVSDVYEDYFIMEDWDNPKYYKQSYNKDGDNITLSGERTELFALMVTESEKIALENMRSNYSSITEKLEKYEKAELDSQKEEILGKSKYSHYLESDEFKEIKKNIDSYSVEELSEKAELAFAKCVEVLGFSFEDEKTEKHAKSVKFSSPEKKNVKGRYGSLFSKNK